MLCSASEEKLAELQINPQAVRDWFRALAKEADITSMPSATLISAMYDKDSVFTTGQYAAELHFVVRRVDDEENTNVKEEAETAGEA